MVRLHNEKRRAIAKGEDTSFPHSASNMLELEWDEELAQGAKLWAQ